MMITRATPYLMLDGTAREAIQFYEKALGAKVEGLSTFGDMPANPNFPMPEEAKGRVAHATLKLSGDAQLMISDSFPGSSPTPGNRLSICLNLAAANATEVFDALAAGGQVIMPLEQTFFSPAYGMVTDKFGITFQIYGEGAQS